MTRKDKPLWIAVVGPKKSGKTSTIEALIPYLKERGYRVATVKHSSHVHIFDREGSDSFRHAQAGAQRVVLRSPGACMFFAYDGDESQADLRMEEFLSDFDVVLCEGFRDSVHAKIVVEGEASESVYKPPIILRFKPLVRSGRLPEVPPEVLEQLGRHVAENLKRRD